MLHLQIISVGKCQAEWIQAGCDHYCKLMSKYADLHEFVVRPEKVLDDAHPALALRREGERILRLSEGTAGPLIALTQTGREFTSAAFARQLQQLANRARGPISFAIGSAHGLSPEVLKRADLALALSTLTFPHELAKLILAEQLYRALSILHGTRYHK